ncbi:hypothetical protein NQ314_011948 [Rhamnusium bicolor]|uniref:PiggyBac transposable element-derived protein domain-containing protein n=1 Tax=Rhamnusium bicolor TaxID=1586634 RepID=A0AAV8XH10_9CUCU|nr:hypothetical protein NQ314_011948 [Rhamnusium bicolor]
MAVLVNTNIFAAQNNAASASTSTENRTPRLNKWVETDAEEIRKFSEIVVWMGLMQLPKLRDYWSTKRIYNKRVPKIINCNRSELSLAMFHLLNNEQPRDPEDRLFKISKFLGIMEKNFKESYIPEEQVCIDESNIPFRGRIYFRQYIPNKRHKYGIKVFKFRVNGGYT